MSVDTKVETGTREFYVSKISQLLLQYGEPDYSILGPVAKNRIRYLESANLKSADWFFNRNWNLFKPGFGRRKGWAKFLRERVCGTGYEQAVEYTKQTTRTADIKIGGKELRISRRPIGAEETILSIFSEGGTNSDGRRSQLSPAKIIIQEMS